MFIACHLQVSPHRPVLARSDALLRKLRFTGEKGCHRPPPPFLAREARPYLSRRGLNISLSHQWGPSSSLSPVPLAVGSLAQLSILMPSLMPTGGLTLPCSLRPNSLLDRNGVRGDPEKPASLLSNRPLNPWGSCQFPGVKRQVLGVLSGAWLGRSGVCPR